MDTQVNEENMANESVESESYVGLGPFGGSTGKTWKFKADSSITKIIICSGEIVDSLIFVCQSGQMSDKFGSDGGNEAEINFEYPNEYLIGISGASGIYDDGDASSVYNGKEAIQKLFFHTNVQKYGPFGQGGPSHQRGGRPFLLSPSEDGDDVIVGFHGRSGAYLNAIGLLVRPTTSISKPKLVTNKPDLVVIRAMAGFFSRNPGPFGGSNGRDWDDGVFSGIKKIVVNVNNFLNVIQSVEFEYVSAKHEGGSILSPRHGGSGPAKQITTIDIDYPNEFLMGIAGYYGAKEVKKKKDYYGYGDESSEDDEESIKSIKFMTNKGVYGPFGKENGTFFSSPAVNGKIVGFFGKTEAYLTAIGVHMEYI